MLAGPTIRDVLIKSEALSVASSKVRRPLVDPSLHSGSSPDTLSYAVPQGNVSNVAVSKVHRSDIHPPTSTVVSNDKLGDAAPAQGNVPNTPTIKPTRSVVHPSPHSLVLSNKPINAVPAQGGAANVATGKVRRPPFDSSLNSGGRNAGRAQNSMVSPSLMPKPLARGGAHTAATRRLVDGGFMSDDQFATARVTPRANVRSTKQIIHDERLVAAMRLAAKGKIVATEPQRMPNSGVSVTTKGASQEPAQPQPSRVSATLDAFKLPTRPKRDNSMSTTGTDQTKISISNAAKQPVRNNVAVNPSLADKDKSEIEAGRRSAGHPVTNTLPSNNIGQAAKSFSAKPAAAIAATTTTTPNPPVGEKAEANAHHDATHKLAQGTDRIESHAGKTPSTPASPKKPASNLVQSTNNLSIEPNAAKTSEVDSGFDIVNATGPSAANGSPLPDPDLIMDQLDEQFTPTLKGFQGWEDDYDSDDSEEWDLGGLAEWKWVGEKSAKKNAAERQA